MLSEFIAQIILRDRTIPAKITSRRKELALALLAAGHGWNIADVSENSEVALCHDEQCGIQPGVSSHDRSNLTCGSFDFYNQRSCKGGKGGEQKLPSFIHQTGLLLRKRQPRQRYCMLGPYRTQQTRIQTHGLHNRRSNLTRLHLIVDAFYFGFETISRTLRSS
jgi:hypothetical protein